MTYGEMHTILLVVSARDDGRFTIKRAYGNDFCLNPRDDAGLEWEIELIDWRRGFRAHPAERTLFRLTDYADFARFYPEFPETHPDLRPGRGARLGWRSNDPGPSTAALDWPEVQQVMALVERAYPRWELRAIHGTTDLRGLRAGAYDGGRMTPGPITTWWPWRVRPNWPRTEPRPGRFRRAAIGMRKRTGGPASTRTMPSPVSPRHGPCSRRRRAPDLSCPEDRIPPRRDARCETAGGGVCPREWPVVDGQAGADVYIAMPRQTRAAAPRLYPCQRGGGAAGGSARASMHSQPRDRPTVRPVA